MKRIPLVGSFIIFFFCIVNTISAGNEFLIDTNVVYSPPFGNQSCANAAFNGSDYFVAWSDDRGISRSGVYGTLVSSSGEVLNPGGVLISDKIGGRFFIVSDGENFLIAAHEYGVRLDKDGNILDSEAFQINNISKTGNISDLIFGGENYFLLSSINDASKHSIYGFRIAPSGKVLDTICISTGESFMTRPKAVFNGDNYFVMWDQGSTYSNVDHDIYAAHVSKEGVVLDTQSIPILTKSGGQISPKVNFDGTNYCFTWRDYELNSRDSTFFSRVSKSGTLLDPEGILIPEVSYLNMWSLGVQYTGKYYNIFMAGWRGNGTGYEVHSYRVFLSEDSIHSEKLELPEIYKYANYNSHSGTIFVVWDSYSLKESSIRGKFFSQSNAGIDTSVIGISNTPNYQVRPDAVSLGNSFFVAWEDRRNETGLDIYGAVIDESGNNLTPNGITITNDSGNQCFPNLAAGTSSNIAVWEEQDRNNIKAALLSKDGDVIKKNIVVSNSGRHADVAFDGTNYLVVWDNSKIFGKRISQEGNILDDTAIAYSNCTYSHCPHIAYGKDCYFVTWSYLVKNPL